MSENELDNILSMTVRQFTMAVAAKTPVPGGGSVSGVVGALAAALGEMSLNYTRGKKSFAQHEELYTHLARRLEHARRLFEQLVAEDVAAYKLYTDATRMEDSPAKTDAVQLALAAIIDIPRQTAKLALAAMKDLLELSGKCNPLLRSDLLAAETLAAAVVRLTDYNVRENASQLADTKAADEIRQGSRNDVKAAEHLLEAAEKAAGL
jgi:formiminotetrahydrofolate cyclodeaminase